MFKKIYLQNLNFLLAFCFFFLLLIFSGCVAQEIKECQKYSGMQKMDCIRHYAILAQDPEKCYQIKDMSLREECFLKSTNPKEAEKLKNQIELTNRLQEEEKKKDEQQKEILKTLEFQIKKCMQETLKSSESCLLEIARANEDITICDEINSEEYRRQCITNIAIKKKSVSECQKLKLEVDKQLCLFYSS
ncbi:MAG: hypothetical protein NC918_00025 [Candidatus Omnitrophica bacterium]|nr:hypothetical protein [Candidatus Omnitrophota bacterium]